jgi:hypothetical protein
LLGFLVFLCQKVSLKYAFSYDNLTAKANVDRLLGEDSVEKEKEKSQKER